MFHTPVETRFAIVDRLLAFGDQPLPFPAAMDLCRHQVQATPDSEATRFAAAARKSVSGQAFRPLFTPADWRAFASFCVVRHLPAGARVLVPGRGDRTLHFLVEGTLCQEIAGAASATSRLKVHLPGAILGEDALFSDGPCDADVRAVEDSVVLELSLPRQKELTASRPAVAFELLRAAGAVIAGRCRKPARREELAAA